MEITLKRTEFGNFINMRYLILVTLFMLSVPLSAKGEELVTVKLVKDIGETSEVEISLIGNYFAFDPSIKIEEGVNYKLIVKGEYFYLKGDGETQKIEGDFFLIPEIYDEQHVITINQKSYLGAMEFRIENQRNLRPVNQLPLEDYLKGVVPFEVFPSWNIETLKAQTVAARTYAYSQHKEEIDDSIQYQVYNGYDWRTSTNQAIEETTGEVITFHGQLIEAFYSSSNGGITETNSNVWGGKALPYFPIRLDPYDPIHPWEFGLHLTQISLEKIDFENEDWWDKIHEVDLEIMESVKKWLNKSGYHGDLKILGIPRFELAPNQTDSNRSVTGSIEIEFIHRLYDGTVLFEKLSLSDVKLNKIRPMMGGDRFRSYLVDSLEDNNGLYKISGRGYGHGVGMSQWGANLMGETGKTYKEIIQFYYPGTEIVPAK